MLVPPKLYFLIRQRSQPKYLAKIDASRHTIDGSGYIVYTCKQEDGQKFFNYENADSLVEMLHVCTKESLVIERYSLNEENEPDYKKQVEEIQKKYDQLMNKHDKGAQEVLKALNSYVYPEKKDFLLVTFEDGIQTMIHPIEDRESILKRFDKMELKYSTQLMNGIQSMNWMRKRQGL